MKIISIINQKGGVGKTTSAINVGAALTLLKKKVLLLDLDPQGNLSSGLNLDPEALEDKNSYFCLVEDNAKAKDYILKTAIDGLDVIGATNNLAGAEIELVNVMVGREFRLKEALTNTGEDYDYVLIDCPPSLGLLTLNALCASNSYLIPMQSEFFALQGLAHIMKTAKMIKKHLNQELSLEGIVLTMFDSRSNLAKQVYQEIKDFAGNKLFHSVVPRRIRLSESTSHGVPGVFYDPACLASRSYIEIARELIQRQNGEEITLKKQSFLPPDPIDRLSFKKNQETKVESKIISLEKTQSDKKSPIQANK